MIGRSFRQLLTLLALALIPAVVSGVIQLQWAPKTPEAPSAVAEGEVTVATAREWGDKVQWVDARLRSRFESGHIADAILLNEDEWGALVAKFLDEWDPDKKIVVYCDGGGCEASKAVAARLRTELKLDNIFVLKGGWDAWQAK